MCDTGGRRWTAGEDALPKFVWKKQGCRDVTLRPVRDGKDILLEVPVLEGWNFGWVAVE